MPSLWEAVYVDFCMGFGATETCIERRAASFVRFGRSCVSPAVRKSGQRKGKPCRGAAGKVLVFGLVQRNGHVKAMPIETASEANIMREIQAHTREGSLFYTDG